ncbi:MAG: VWA domain-containing protein, partial [Acidobacteria bacterium]|nr:VWA domain-containing protein [Acidobacteriota bacterium]
QKILRFEQVRDLPYHAAILLDVSASMEDSLETVRNAALEFFQEGVKPKDRAALITFNDRPNLAVKFTNQVDSLAGGLAGLKAERGTSLYDSLVFTLYAFNGIRGQKAVLLLSDGKDESSKFSYEDTLEYARRAGVTVYAIGLKEAAKDGGARKKLAAIAEETGGRAFFVKDPAELASIYAAIQKELRSQYLIAYQSSNSTGDPGFREVQVKTTKPGVEVKTLSGYYP